MGKNYGMIFLAITILNQWSAMALDVALIYLATAKAVALLLIPMTILYTLSWVIGGKANAYATFDEQIAQQTIQK